MRECNRECDICPCDSRQVCWPSFKCMRVDGAFFFPRRELFNFALSTNWSAKYQWCPAFYPCGDVISLEVRVTCMVKQAPIYISALILDTTWLTKRGWDVSITLTSGFNLQAENRWAGACLLGVTCQECTRQRFLECYSLWFTKLLLPLRVSTWITY